MTEIIKDNLVLNNIEKFLQKIPVNTYITKSNINILKKFLKSLNDPTHSQHKHIIKQIINKSKFTTNLKKKFNCLKFTNDVFTLSGFPIKDWKLFL